MELNEILKHAKPIPKEITAQWYKYYKDTIEKNDIASNVISLTEFVEQYKGINPLIEKMVYGGSYIPNQERNCLGNSLFLATVILRDEFEYIEGVIYHNNHYFHHSWLYSKTLKCFVDPTLNPQEYEYFISDTISGMDAIEELVIYDEEEDTYTPVWKNKDVIPIY